MGEKFGRRRRLVMGKENSLLFLSSSEVFSEGEGTSFTRKEDRGENNRERQVTKRRKIEFTLRNLMGGKQRYQSFQVTHKEGINYSIMTISQTFHDSGTLITFECVCSLLSS